MDHFNKDGHMQQPDTARASRNTHILPPRYDLTQQDNLLQRDGLVLQQQLTGQFAALVGIPPETVRKSLRAIGAEFREHKTKATDENIAKLYSRGLTMDQIARRYNIPYAELSNRLRDLGVQLRPSGTRPAIVGISDDELRKQYEQGSSIRRIATSIGADASTVRRKLLAIGVKLRHPRPTPVIPDNEIVELYRGGMGLVSLGAKAEVHPRVIRDILVNHEVTIRNPNKISQLDTGTIDKLVRMYVEDQLSINEITHRIGLNWAVVQRHLTERGVPIRGLKEATRLRHQQNGPPGHWWHKHFDHHRMIRLRQQRGWSTGELALRVSTQYPVGKVDKAHFAALERGEAAVGWHMFYAICRALEVPKDALVSQTADEQQGTP